MSSIAQTDPRLMRGLVSVLRFLSLACAAACATSCASDADLTVDVKTDLVAGVEFHSIRVEASTSPPSSAAARVARVETEITRDDADALLGGFRAGELSLAAGTYWVRVSLLDEGGDIVVARPTLVAVSANTGITVLLTRDCVDVMCPALGGDASLLACLAGECVDPRCSPSAPEHCPAPECTSSDDCDAPLATCAAAQCSSEGICFEASVEESCADGKYCRPETGCEDITPPAFDGGMMLDAGRDSGTDSASDSGSDSGSDTGSDSGPDAPMDAGTTCAPSSCDTGNSCEVGFYNCDLDECEAIAVARAGATCGADQVCDGRGECIDCVMGATCAPPGELCLLGEMSCTGTPVCNATDDLAEEGTTCGVDQICSAEGVCVPECEAVLCDTGNECEVGLFDCDDDACALVGVEPAGTSCGVDEVCDGAGNCVACSEGESCVPSEAPCRLGALECGHAPVCVATEMLADEGTSCGPSLVCDADGACVCDDDMRFCAGACRVCPTDEDILTTTCDATECVAATCEEPYSVVDGECDCEVGTHECAGSCVSSTSTATCGTSCTPCDVVLFGTATCDGTTCGIDCDDGRVLVSGACVPLVQQAYIKASNPNVWDSFGTRIAVSDDGNTLVVSAYEDSNATGIDGNQSNNSADFAGAVYVFTRSGSTWSQQAYIKASNTAASDQFGATLALSGDGDTLAVGAVGEDSSATGIGGDQGSNAAANSGAVYVFTRSGGTWSQQAYVKASNTDAGDSFSFAGVALSTDGNTLAVAAQSEGSSATGIGGDPTNNAAPGSGAVYVFSRIAATWSQQAYVKASNAAASDSFGAHLALSGDGNTLAVGAIGEDSNATGVGGDESNNSALSSGAVYVFTRTGTTWTQHAYVKASNTEADDWFGVGVSLSTDGNTLAVGSLEDSSATGIDGNQASNAANGSGAVYVFARTGATWEQEAYVKASNPDASDWFGQYLSLSGNGSALAVGAIAESSSATGIGGNQASNGAPTSGAAYLFTRAGTTWSQAMYIKASNTTTLDEFGRVAISADGSTLVVSAWKEDSNASGIGGDQSNNASAESGAVYVFSGP